MENFEERIYVSVTGKDDDWKAKLEDINRFNITEAAVFIERFEKWRRKELYAALLRSSVKKVPLVHLRHDAGNDEIEFFIKNFGTRYFNIHESCFDRLNQWRGYWGNLYLEMDYNNRIAANVDVGEIGGFCVDLAHFKAAIARGTDEAFYIISKKNTIKTSSNHLSGYSFDRDEDIHFVENLKDFDYLSTLPKCAFGQVIAIEVDNSIADQLEFKERAAAILNNYFNFGK